MPLFIFVIILLGIGTFTMTTSTTSSVRGVRIHNPLNIRIAGNAWKGKVTPSRDKAFETFKAP
ncbi:structural protein, partial [Vibrio parahaemolyticus]|nr:structural protein [Vibrio parahaemolyticus]